MEAQAASTTSKDAWLTVLADLGVDAKPELVKEFLDKGVNTYEEPAPTAGSIFNAVELREMIRSKFPSQQWMFRS